MTTFYAFGTKRRSDAEYQYASRDEQGVVRFHKTYLAAKRRAGRYGHTSAVSTDPAHVGGAWRS